jgi:cyclin-dependent kinase 8/11
VSPTAIREIGLLRELRHPNVVSLEAVHISRPDASISLAFDYAEHDLYEMIWHHRDRLGGEAWSADWGGVRGAAAGGC